MPAPMSTPLNTDLFMRGPSSTSYQQQPSDHDACEGAQGDPETDRFLAQVATRSLQLVGDGDSCAFLVLARLLAERRAAFAKRVLDVACAFGHAVHTVV